MEESGMLQSQFEHQQADPQGKVLAGELGWLQSPSNPVSPASGSYTGGIPLPPLPNQSRVQVQQFWLG